MINFNNIQTIYFIGIGGIGMSALARYFNAQRKKVLGYDKTATQITSNLQNEGISITFIDQIQEINPSLLDKKSTLVVYTPAIPSCNKILTWFQDHQYFLLKRAQVLGLLSKESKCLAVAGTHGKTTTSAILAHLLMACKMPVTAFLGGILENYNSNFLYNGSNLMVVEADEFDRSFLQLKPDIACITSVDADHLDIYKSDDSIKKTFQQFSSLISDKEHLLVQKNIPITGKTVAVNEHADFQAKNVRIKDGQYLFDFISPTITLKDLRFSLPGKHNLFNAVTALGMAILAGCPSHCLPKALQNFKGVQRRFSYKIKRENLVLIDDYAHHPTEIDALYHAVSELYPNQQKLIVFQPHLFSRTRDFASEFAKSLAQFDELILLDIYPARELPIKGISSKWLLDQVELKNKKLVRKEELSQHIKKSKTPIKLLVGAGDIGAEVEKITTYLAS